MLQQAKATNRVSKSPWLYGLLLLFFIYLYIQILGFRHGEVMNPIITGLYFVQFGVHEASHLVVMFLPQILVAMAGSIGEVLFPILIVIASLRAKAYFAMIFGLLWLGLALRSVGLYMADARAQAIPIIGPGQNVHHDWNYVFGELGWLGADTVIGGTVQAVGAIIGALALVYGLMLVASYFMNTTE